MSRMSLFAAICSIIVSSSVANASIQFSQADLLGMQVDLVDSVGYGAGGGTGILTPGWYEDGVTPMQGSAGATGRLKAGGTAYYALNAGSLAAFNVAIAGGGQVLTAIGNNDNNQTWNVGIWYKTVSGIFTDFVSLTPTQSGGVSLALPNSVLAAGVAVRSSLSQPDEYHASWGVPEASTIAVWSVLSLAGLGVACKKRLAH